MASQKTLPDLALGRRWPHKFLQVMPASWKQQYLVRKSGGENGSENFTLVKPFAEANRFLIAWPEKREDVLIAFSALRALHAATGRDAVYAHLAADELLPMIRDLFPGDQVLGWKREDLAWHEPSVQAVCESLGVFSPQIAVNLMQPCPLVVQALVKASGAGLRMALDAQMEWPYSNMRLEAATHSSMAAHYFQILNPWRYAGFSPEEKWAKLLPDEGQMQDAANAWAAAGAASEENWLYVHDASNPSRPLDDDLYSWLWERIHTRDAEEVGIVLAVVNPATRIFAPEGMWRNVPVLKPADFSDMLGIVSSARGVSGFQGWGIHCASLADVRCLAFLESDQSLYDVSAFNPLFEVEWI